MSAGTFTVGTTGAVDLELNAAGSAMSYDRIGISLEPDASDPALNGRNVLGALMRAPDRSVVGESDFGPRG